jgi:hypothetical protein
MVADLDDCAVNRPRIETIAEFLEEDLRDRLSQWPPTKSVIVYYPLLASYRLAPIPL